MFKLFANFNNNNFKKIIYKYMEFNDRSETLFHDPNAYIQNWGKDNLNSKTKQQRRPQKIVFQEPYECMPNFYVDNNFKKGNCDCIPKPKPKPDCPPRPNFPFDLKNLLPLLSGLNKSGNNGGLANIINLLNSNKSEGSSASPNFDISSLINTFSNSGGLSNLLSIFKPKQTQTKNKKQIKSTDFQIKNYTRVE